MTHHCNNRELTVAMAARYDLEEEHVSFVTGSGKNTNKVESIVEDAAELREAESVAASQGAFEGTPEESDESPAADEASDEAEQSEGDDASSLDLTEAETEESVDDESEDDEQAGLSDFM